MDGDDLKPPVAGDVILGQALLCWRNEPGAFSADDQHVFLTTSSGSKLVWLRIGEKTRAEFLALTTAALGDLRGVEVDCPDGAVLARLSDLDLARTCVTIATSAASIPGTLPTLPSGLRYLATTSHSSPPPGFKDLSALRDLTELVFLRVCDGVDALDAGQLVGMRHLHWLQISGLENVATFPELPELRTLVLAQTPVSSLDFARRLPRLRHIDIGMTSVEDLAPLTSLSHLERIDANGSGVRSLPAGLAAIRRLELFATPIDDAAIDSFAATHPGAQVIARWQDELRRALAGASRVRVRPGGMCHRGRVEEETTIFEVRDPKAVRELVSHLEIVQEGTDSCMCCGDPSLELSSETELLATVTVQHGRALRWYGHWPGDAPLTAASAEWLERWLARKGQAGPGAQPAARRTADRISVIAFSPSGELVASGYWSGAVKVWRTEDLAKGNASPIRATVARLSSACAHVFPRPRAEDAPGIAALAFGPSKTLIMGDVYGGLTEWNVDSASERVLAPTLGAMARKVSISADGSRLLVSGFRWSCYPSPLSQRTRTEVRELASDARLRSLTLPWDDSSPVALSRDGRSIIFGGSERVTTRSVASGELVRELKVSRRPALAPDGRRVAISDYERTILMDVESGATLWSSKQDRKGFFDVSFLPGERLAVVDVEGGRVRLLSIANGDVERELEIPRSSLQTPHAFSPDGRFFATATPDGTLALAALEKR